MQFPFPSVRAPQREMIDDVRAAVQNGRHVIANAPTGLGKTAAVLYPAMEYALDNGKSVFFLTSRLSQHKMAIETLQKLGSISAVDIVGKKWLCSYDMQDVDNVTFSSFCAAMVRDGQCKFFKNFRDAGQITMGARRVIHDLSQKPMHSEDAKFIAGSRYCTYELLVEMARTSSAIVGDYFHVFSSASDAFFRRIKKDLNRSIIIVDEAHNLPERIRNSLSSKISTRTIDRALKENESYELGVADEIRCIDSALTGTATERLIDSNETFSRKEDFVGRIEKLYAYVEAVKALTSAGEQVLEQRKKSSIFRIAQFLDAWKGDDFGYARIVSRERYNDKNYISMFYDCLDPSVVSRSIIGESHSTILMSGTLYPMQMYRDVLGMVEERTELRSYGSPFAKENRLNIIVNNVTTRYKERTPESFSRLAKITADAANAVRGNVAVYFPSYDLMKNICFLAKGSIRKEIVMEQQGMTKEQRKEMLERFACHRNAVLMGVMGGSFSEGIDLPGEKLNGVIVIGLPLEKPTLSVKALIDYYDERFRRGRDYGYFYPAMIKVMQAAGRCIRTENDIGVCVFADDRYMWKNYRYIFPNDWSFKVSGRPEKEIGEFFGNRPAQQ